MRPMILCALVSLAGCHRDDPPRALPEEHGTPVTAQTSASFAEPTCLSHGKSTTPREYFAIAQRVTRRIGGLAERLPALAGLELSNLRGPNDDQGDVIRFTLFLERGVSWEKPQPSPGKMSAMSPRFAGDDAIDLSIDFFSGPDFGRLMVPLIAIGEMNAKLMVLSPHSDEISAAIRAILLDESQRFSDCAKL